MLKKIFLSSAEMLNFSRPISFSLERERERERGGESSSEILTFQKLNLFLILNLFTIKIVNNFFKSKSLKPNFL